MKIKRFLTDEEEKQLMKFSNDISLINLEPYGFVEKNNDTKIIKNILKNIIGGFSEFSCFVKNNKIKVQYNWNFDNPESNLGSWYGVGYITIKELKNGFTN